MDRLTDEAITISHQRLLGTVRLQKVAGNSLDAEDIALFEMFERGEGWPYERCRQHIIDLARAAGTTTERL